jgi:hypothetical protein
MKNESESRRALHAAFNALAAASIEVFTLWVSRSWVSADISSHEDNADQSLLKAATLLEVDVNADANEIRMAFRSRIKSSITTGDFHDHGGANTDRRALELIAAKNMLLEHAAKLAAK